MMMDYQTMENRWGAAFAMGILRELERVHGIPANDDLPPEERLQRAADKAEGKQ